MMFLSPPLTLLSKWGNSLLWWRELWKLNLTETKREREANQEAYGRCLGRLINNIFLLIESTYSKNEKVAKVDMEDHLLMTLPKQTKDVYLDILCLFTYIITLIAIIQFYFST